MQTGIYAIKDNKSQSIPSPVLWMHRHVAAAIRMFGEILTDPKGLPSKYPQDFDLIHIADYDEEAQMVTPVPLNKQLVLSGSDMATMVRENANELQQLNAPHPTLHKDS